MPTLTLPIKVYSSRQLKLVQNQLNSTLEGLVIETKVHGVTARGWVQITISGEDETVAARHIANQIGVCPTQIGDIGEFSTITGRITALNKGKNEFHVDIGVSSPDIVDAVIPLRTLQAQLADGRKIAREKLIGLFGFHENMPLNVKILSIDNETSFVEAMLSEKQLAQYKNWMQSLLDRLIVLGASVYEIRLALKSEGLMRDTVGVEALGLFEYAIVCKLGTDAVGLISKIGKNLKDATFAVFSPEKVLGFFDYSTALTF